MICVVRAHVSGGLESKRENSAHLLCAVRTRDRLRETDHALELADRDAVRAAAVALRVLAAEPAIQRDELLRSGRSELQETGEGDQQEALRQQRRRGAPWG